MQSFYKYYKIAIIIKYLYISITFFLVALIPVSLDELRLIISAVYLYSFQLLFD